jgi:hypothetical protein
VQFTCNNGTCRAALIALASCGALAAHAQTSRPQNGEFVMLDRPAVFEITPNTGSLKESVQKGQQLVWHPKERPNEPRFQVTNISVAFLRSESGGQVKMTFAGNVSSLGYLASEEAKLNAIIRAKGGASLHSWNFGVSIKCADKDQPLTPLTHDVPNDLAQNIFTNVSTVEIAEPAAFFRGEGSAVQLMGECLECVCGSHRLCRMSRLRRTPNYVSDVDRLQLSGHFVGRLSAR